MPICPTCEGEIAERISCLSAPVEIDGELFDPIRWGDERGSRRSGKRWRVDAPCRDCGTPPGGVHHPGCCLESCPKCFGQALGCPCFGDPDDELDLFDQDADPAPPSTPRRRRHLRAYCHSHFLPRHHRR